MARFVIGPDVALSLAKARARISGKQKLLAPTLLRSEVLALLYESFRRGDVDRKDAREQLDYLRSLKLRLLGDRVLQRVAWEIAEQLGWPDTFRAEYLALTRLQADAFVTLDRTLARQVRGVVRLGTISDILET